MITQISHATIRNPQLSSIYDHKNTIIALSPMDVKLVSVFTLLGFSIGASSKDINAKFFDFAGTAVEYRQDWVIIT